MGASTDSGAKPARILKSAYYPVNIDRGQIRNDPHKRERDLAWKYRATPGWIGMPGRYLLSKHCYTQFQWLPAQ